MFDKKSRYVKETPYTVKDHQGRLVAVIPVPDPPRQTLFGIHLRRQGQKLDHLAYRYLDDPAGFWRLCEFNDVMMSEMLSEADEIAIPQKGIK
jgi:hypothetical protein